MKIFIALVVFTAIASSASAKKRCFPLTDPTPDPGTGKPGKCPTYEVYSECGAHGCINTCQDPTFASRSKCSCVAGCICADGYIRDQDTKKCVLPSACPKTNVCPANEEYTDCGTACPRTCANKDSKVMMVCTMQCVTGCFCSSGYVRDANGVCVLESACPKIDVCPANEVYSECGANGCQNTCANPTLSQVCRATCIAGCICVDGYIRDANNVCVLATACPGSNVCEENEEYTDCGTACPRTCANKDKPIRCTKQCVKGCFCSAGYVRDEGFCVLESACPATNVTCPKGEVFSECSAYCQRHCGPIRDCARPQQNCNPGCVCPAGKIRGDQDECVLESECPEKQCSKNEVYGSCGGSICQKTCENPQLTTMCKAPCKPGCGCADGFIRNTENNQCVRPSACPKTNVCPANEEYTDCGTSCQKTCANKDSPMICTKQCVQGCFCAAGYVRDANNVCVLESSCPKIDACPKGEVFSDCGAYCQRRCGPPTPCAAPPQDCNPGCVCPDRFVRGDNNECIFELDCPDKECKKHEVYSECGKNSCQKSCETLFMNVACRPICTAGCICEEGYVHNINSVCILESQCPAPSSKCGKNELLDPCTDLCGEATCASREAHFCGAGDCKSKCLCAKGYVRDKPRGVCIKTENCPKVVAME